MLRLVLCCLTVLTACLSFAEDWPRFRGADSQAVWREEGIVDQLPEGDLKAAWRVPCAYGYAGPAVAEGRVYLFEYDRASGEITDNPGARDQLEGVERLRCLDSETGEELWKYEYERSYFISYPRGPRCTPTVDGEHVYILGAEGDLTCLRTDDGSPVWSKNFGEEYGAPTPMWGHSAHPLVEGDTLYCLVGGEGSVAVAFDKQTGEEKWRALSAPSINNECGYCPPTMIEHDGTKLLIAFTPEQVAALDPASGTVLWEVPIVSAYGMSIAQPLLLKEGLLFISGYGEASVCLQLKGGAEAPEVVWSGTPKTSISASNVSPLPDASRQTIYGVHANGSALVAVDPHSGERLWETRQPVLGSDQRSRDRHGTAFPVRQGDTDRFWLAAETGDLVHARLSVQGYEELGRKQIIEPTGDAFGRPVWWSHPAFAEQSIFARNDKEVIRISLAAE